MKWIFNATHQNTGNTGHRSINGSRVVEVPNWVRDQVAIGEEITIRNIEGELHWYIKGVEVFEVKP